MLVGDSHGDVHTDDKMLLHLNRVCRDISMRSRSIVEGLYLPANVGQARYGLPEGFLRLDIAAWQQESGNYQPLSPITMDIASWAVHNEVKGKPRYFDIFGRAAVERASAESTEVFTVSQIGLLPLDGDEEDTVQFTERPPLLKRGDRLLNMTDGSEGRIIFTQDGLDPQTNLVTMIVAYSQLQGGTRGFLQEGDAVRFLSPGAPLQSLIVTPVPSEDQHVGQESLFLFVARVHREISSFDIHEENDDVELDPEFESALLEYVIYYMRRDELGANDTETQAQFLLANKAYQDALPDVRDRIRAWIIRWHRRQGLRYRQRDFSRTPVAQFPVGAAYPSV